MKSLVLLIGIVLLPLVSLQGYHGTGGFGYSSGYSYFPQSFVSPVVLPISQANRYVGQLGPYEDLVSYLPPPVLLPLTIELGRPTYSTITPVNTLVQYQKSLYTPIHGPNLGGIKILGPGLPTHPDYRPPSPAQWKRLWPPLNAYGGNGGVEGEVTSNIPETAPPENKDNTEENKDNTEENKDNTEENKDNTEENKDNTEENKDNTEENNDNSEESAE